MSRELGTNGVETRHMQWDCPDCGTRKLIGSIHRHCPACGSAQDPNALYAPSAADRIAVEDHSLVGRDVVCLACHTPSSAAANYCRGCGCSLAGAREVGTGDAFGRAEGFAGESGAFARSALERKRRTSAQEQLAGAAAHDEAVADAARSRRRVVLAGGVALGLMVFFFIRSRDTGVEVQAIEHSWSRTIEIERFSEIRETTQCDQVPERAKLTRAKGGADECEYRMNAWHTVRVVRSEGNALSPEPSWPDVRLITTGEGNCLLCEREGVSEESYVVSFTYEDTIATCEFDLESWQSIGVGATFEARADPQTGSLDCDSLIAN